MIEPNLVLKLLSIFCVLHVAFVRTLNFVYDYFTKYLNEKLLIILIMYFHLPPHFLLKLIIYLPFYTHIVGVDLFLSATVVHHSLMDFKLDTT